MRLCEYLGALCSLAMLLFTCDVPGLVILKNKTSDSVCIEYTGNRVTTPTIKPFGLQANSDTESVEIFGFGYWWTNDMIDNYSKSVDTFRVVTDQYEYVITDSLSMNRYMKRTRSKGLFKAYWTVKLPMNNRTKRLFEVIATESNQKEGMSD